MQQPRPATLIAELSYQCPLHCPYCSNPLDIGHEKYRTRAGDRALDPHLPGGARARRAAARAHGRRADAAPRSGRAVRGRARRRSLLVAHHRRGPLHPRARGGAEVGRARPRADLDPEPGRRGERPHRRQQVVREEDRGRPRREGARLPADDQLRPAPAEPRSDRGDPRSRARSRGTAARARQHAVLRLGGRQPGCADAVLGAAAARGGCGAALPRAGRPQGRRPLGAPRLLRGASEAVHGRLGPDGDRGRSERRRAALPGGVDDPGSRVRQRPRALARVDLERVRRVHALPRHGLDAGAVPHVPARRQEVDFGGCRCQALRLTGDATATDPVCRFSPHHDRVVSARESAQTDEFVYRAIKRPVRA